MTCSTPLAIKLSSTVSLHLMAYVFCNQCGHRNPPESGFCSSCGSVLDSLDDHTITLTKVDPLQDAPGADDDVVVNVGDLATGVASLIVRTDTQAGETIHLSDNLKSLGRHPTSRINAERIDDEVVLHQGDELQVGKFRLVFFDRADG
jgi:hypothetical protein